MAAHVTGGVGVVLLSPSDPSVRGWVTLTFDSSPIKGEGGLVVPHPVDTALKPV